MFRLKTDRITHLQIKQYRIEIVRVLRSRFFAGITKMPKEYCRISRDFRKKRRKICKQDACKAVRRSLCGIAFKLLGLLLVVLGAFLLDYFNIGCVWRFFLGIKCPGCGMTRALLSLLRGDIKAAFSFHPMFWSLPVIYLYILLDGRIFKNNILNFAPLIAIGAGFAINYIVKIIL